jgi:hypothetical protein
VRIIGRTLLILLISGAAAGGIYFIVHGSVGEATAEYGWRDFDNAGSGSRRASSGAFRERSPDYYTENRPGRDDFAGHGHDSEGRFSLGRGIAGILRSLAVISVITVVVVRLRRSSFLPN